MRDVSVAEARANRRRALPDPPRRRVRHIVAVFSVVTLFAVGSGGPGGAQTRTAGVPEGEWEGWLTFIAASPGGPGGTGSGTFTMSSAAGAVTGDASWVFGPADATAVVQGDATAPQLQVTSILVNGSPSPVSASDPPIQLTITTSTCEMVTGSGSGVGGVVASGSWTAIREGALTVDPAGFQRDLAELVERMKTIEAEIVAGEPVDDWDLLVALLAAESVSQGLSRSPECSGFGSAHSSIAVGLLADLLGAVIDNGEAVGNQMFADLVRAAVGAGSIGAGASHPGAEDLALDVLDEIQFRIDQAIADDDAGGLRILAVLAHQMGYGSLEDAALAGLEAVGA